MDVTSLYTNTPAEGPDGGLEAFEKALETREEKRVPRWFLNALLQQVLDSNIFEFNGQLWRQCMGLGTDYACGLGATDTAGRTLRPQKVRTAPTAQAPRLREVIMTSTARPRDTRDLPGKCSGGHLWKLALIFLIIFQWGICIFFLWFLRCKR